MRDAVVRVAVSRAIVITSAARDLVVSSSGPPDHRTTGGVTPRAPIASIVRADHAAGTATLGIASATRRATAHELPLTRSDPHQRGRTERRGSNDTTRASRGTRHPA